MTREANQTANLPLAYYNILRELVRQETNCGSSNQGNLEGSAYNSKIDRHHITLTARVTRNSRSLFTQTFSQNPDNPSHMTELIDKASQTSSEVRSIMRVRFHQLPPLTIFLMSLFAATVKRSSLGPFLNPIARVSWSCLMARFDGFVEAKFSSQAFPDREQCISNQFPCVEYLNGLRN